MSEACVAEPRGRAINRCLTHREDWTRGEWPDTSLPCPFAYDAADPGNEAASSAPPATWPTTGPPSAAAIASTPPAEPPSPDEAETPRGGPSDGDGSRHGRSESDAAQPPSKPSGPPSTDSTRLWREPRTAMEFAGQANKVATMILNGSIDVETGRLYSSIARTVAQALSTEVSRARYLQNEPNLTFPEDVDEVPAED